MPTQYQLLDHDTANVITQRLTDAVLDYCDRSGGAISWNTAQEINAIIREVIKRHGRRN